MATGGGVPNPVLCPVCLDPFTDPRFLPCHHTFCAQCIQDIADKYLGAEFPCPSCRKPTTLPAGGVQELQINYYVNVPPATSQAQPLTPAVGELMCSTHEEEKLRFYCTVCRLAVCRDCKLTVHEGHRSEDLGPAQQRIKTRMRVVQEFFSDKVRHLKQQVECLQQRKEDALSRKPVVLKSIQDRHATMVAAADKARDEALQSLDAAMKEVEDDYSAQLAAISAKDTFQVAKINDQKLEHLKDKNILEVLQLATYMSVNVELDGSQIQQELQRRFPSDSVPDSGVRSVVHRFPHTEACGVDSLVQRSRDFVGSVEMTVLTASIDGDQCPVEVTERFTCGQEPNTRVFSICHDGDDDDKSWLFISYDHCGLDKNAPVKMFTESGELKGTDDDNGRVSYKRRGKGKVMYTTPEEGWLRTFNKSLTAGHFKLCADTTGEAKTVIYEVKVTSTEPLETESTVEFEIKVGLHRAVDTTEFLFVVLEEPQPPHEYRQVRMYQLYLETSVSTYTSPIQPFQPSDVCFYTLGGQRLLLITDEANDAIHVVRVRLSGFTFLRYLAPGCPCLIQPTALNIDIKGRLWVACGGGNIITIQPKD